MNRAGRQPARRMGCGRCARSRGKKRHGRQELPREGGAAALDLWTSSRMPHSPFGRTNDHCKCSSGLWVTLGNSCVFTVHHSADDGRRRMANVDRKEQRTSQITVLDGRTVSSGVKLQLIPSELVDIPDVAACPVVSAPSSLFRRRPSASPRSDALYILPPVASSLESLLSVRLLPAPPFFDKDCPP